MADKKISALTGATTPLAGTEVLPIVQSSATKQVSVANLTAGRAISATQLTLTTGNLIVASGQGIDFSATSHPAGMTSELLADYEEGTWTPTFTSTDATFSYTANYGVYTKNGRQVTATFTLLASASGTVTNLVYISSLPFTSGSTPNVAYGGYVTFSTTSLTPVISLGPSVASAQLTIPITAADATPTVLGMNGVNKWLQGVIIYFV
jgi:hypothetical protein